MSLTAVASTSKTSFLVNEISSERIYVTITNTLGEDIEIIQYLSPLAYVKEIYFNGTKLSKNYIGENPKVIPAKDSDYTLVPKGQTIVYKIPIQAANSIGSFYYDITNKGSYIVALNDVVECKISNNQTKVNLVVNSVSFDVQ